MTETAAPAQHRAPLTRERVLLAAVELADRDGIDRLSMRRLGLELGVEAMALYRHVQNKDDMVDGIVELVIGQIDIPAGEGDWAQAMRRLAMSARSVMLQHPWAPPVIVERATVGPATMRVLEAVMRILDGAGFSIDLAHHALHVLGSRVLGFTQDPFDDSPDTRPDPEAAARFAAMMAIDHPHLARLAVSVSHDGGLGGCDDDFEFAFGLDLILEGLERQRLSAGAS